MRPLLSHNTRSAFLKLQNLQISSNFQGIRTTPEKRGDVVCCVCVSDLLEMQLGCDIKNRVSEHKHYGHHLFYSVVIWC